MQKKFIYIGIAVLIGLAFLAWLFWESTKPLPGQHFESEGREHVSIGTTVNYQTNPPTSGPHYADWSRAGVYPDPLDDRNLVHSLEHGYVIMHYKCRMDNGQWTINNATGSAEASGSAMVDAQTDCDDRKNKLSQIRDEKGGKKLIVIARPNLETNFALTAWQYLDKFDEFDEERIKKFLDAHFDNGPERTME